MKKSYILFDLLEIIVIALGIFIIVQSFIASPHVIVGTSMNDDFQNGEFLFADKISYRFHNPERGDVVIFKHDDTSDYIKRVVGLPGDKVMIHNGSVYVNDKKIDETIYIRGGAITNGMSFLANDETITVPPNDYFVLGDNREESSDSRAWGYVDKSVIEGKAFFVYWPLPNMFIVPQIKYTDSNDILTAVKG